MLDWRRELLDLTQGNEEYATFNKRIVKTSKTVIGVRMPDLRKLAKKVAKETDSFGEMQSFLHDINPAIFEEVMLSGLVLNAVKLLPAEHIALTREYLKPIDSWAEIDVFVEKKPKYATAEYWDFAREMAQSDKEFYARYGVISFMSNFLDNEHLQDVFAALRALGDDAYYVKMAAAWLYAETAVNFYDQTIAELAKPEIDPWTRRKAYQKMLESYRITDEHKDEIRRLRSNEKH